MNLTNRYKVLIKKRETNLWLTSLFFSTEHRLHPMLMNLERAVHTWQKWFRLKLNLLLFNPGSFITLNPLNALSHLRVKAGAVKYHTTPYFTAQPGSGPLISLVLSASWQWNCPGSLFCTWLNIEVQLTRVIPFVDFVNTAAWLLMYNISTSYLYCRWGKY